MAVTDQSSPRRPRVALVAPDDSVTFIAQDRSLLSDEFEVEFAPARGFWSLRHLRSVVSQADIVLIWFMGRHALPAVMVAGFLGRPIVGIIGGFEVAWDADTGHGIRPGSLKEKILRWMLRRCRAIVTVSGHSRADTLARVPELAERIRLVHNAVDTSTFAPDASCGREGVLCVAMISATTIKVKRLDLYAAIAARMPQTRFTLIGPALDGTARNFVRDLPPNLIWRDALRGDQLVRAYQCASVYCQLSRYESFSLALAEAMACGCIPVISKAAALPEVGGPHAIIVNPPELETGVQAVAAALQAPESLREDVRRHIVERFSTARRQVALTQILREALRKT
ncbi:MAG TPA: glycosyltransferase family 4 protein [bacterium]|nr:glycosyltransferase family 4 protein [bacterium]